jgi:hypothetical protein
MPIIDAFNLKGLIERKKPFFSKNNFCGRLVLNWCLYYKTFLAWNYFCIAKTIEFVSVRQGLVLTLRGESCNGLH